MRERRSFVMKRLPLVLWPLGIAAEFAALFFLFRGDAEVTAVAVVNRSVGGSFIACGLIAWQRRPDSRTGPLMTLTGFLYLSEALLSEVDSSVAYTLGQWAANWWIPPFAALVLGFPSGRLSSWVDRAIVGGFVFGTVVGQLVWLLLPALPAGDGERVPDLRRRGSRQHDRPLRERLQRNDGTGARGRRHRALDPRGAAAAAAAAADAGGLAHDAGPDHPDLLRGVHRRVHPRQPGGHVRPARVGAAGVPVRHPAPAARARRHGGPRRRAPPGSGPARARGCARESAGRPVAGGRLLAPALRRLRRRRRHPRGPAGGRLGAGGDARRERGPAHRRARARRLAGAPARPARGGVRRGERRDRARAPPGGAERAGGRAPGLARAHRRGGRRRAAAARAQPPRRRPAAPRRDRAAAAPAAGPGRRRPSAEELVAR